MKNIEKMVCCKREEGKGKRKRRRRRKGRMNNNRGIWMEREKSTEEKMRWNKGCDDVV